MTWTEDGDSLLGLLGKPSNDPDVVEVLGDFDVRWAPKLDNKDLPEDEREWYVWRPSSKRGIEFSFQDEADLRALPRDQRGQGPLLLSQVCFYGDHEGVLPFKGKFPYGISLQSDRLAVRSAMKSVSDVCRSHKRDVWELDKHRVVVEHKRGGSVLGSVLCKLRLSPWPPAMLPPLPTLDQIIGQFGAYWYTSEMRELFFPLGLDRCGPDIATRRYADLREEAGLELYFYRDRARADDDVTANKGAEFSSAKFYSSRYLDARQWPGELPLGLEFDASYRELVSRVGREPDDGRDENLDGYAIWHFEDYSLHVQYSNVDNVILCCSVFAPGAMQPR